MARGPRHGRVERTAGPESTREGRTLVLTEARRQRRQRRRWAAVGGGWLASRTSGGGSGGKSGGVCLSTTHISTHTFSVSPVSDPWSWTNTVCGLLDQHCPCIVFGTVPRVHGGPANGVNPKNCESKGCVCPTCHELLTSSSCQISHGRSSVSSPSPVWPGGTRLRQHAAQQTVSELVRGKSRAPAPRSMSCGGGGGGGGAGVGGRWSWSGGGGRQGCRNEKAGAPIAQAPLSYSRGRIFFGTDSVGSKMQTRVRQREQRAGAGLENRCSGGGGGGGGNRTGEQLQRRRRRRRRRQQDWRTGAAAAAAAAAAVGWSRSSTFCVGVSRSDLVPRAGEQVLDLLIRQLKAGAVG